jgi:hypothetical protein
MRKSIFLAISILISAVPTARAVPLQDCSQGASEKRISCLQANIVLLNSSHEAIAGELRKAIADLTANVATLTTKVGTLTAQVNTLSTQVGQLPKLDSIVVQWYGHDNTCITYMGSNVVQLVDTCLDPNKNRFTIRPFHQ